MQQKASNKNDTVPQAIFKSTAAECYLLFQQYRLKTHIVGSNIEKDIFYQCYDALQGRIIDRYSKMLEQLKKGISDLERNFVLAKGSHLRTLNNILRNYRRRIGTLSNEPLSNFKYNKYDKYQKMLMQCLIYNDKDNYLQLLQFREELTISMEQGDKEINDKYRPNEKIKDNYKKMLEVVDKSQCYAYKYYENFQRSMITTIFTLENCFEKLNTYLTVWENIGSTKAYQSKSQKQRQMQEKTQDGLYSRRFFEQETEEHLEQLYNNCPAHSLQKQELRKKLNEFRRYTAQKEKKLDLIGKMFNKRKNRAGILVSKYRDLSVVDWFFNIQGNRASMPYLDQFRNYTAQVDNTHNEFKPTGFQLQKPFKKDRLDQIKQHLQKCQFKSTFNYQWQYDKYGKDGFFDLIECGSQLVQKRVEFQIVRQIQLQNSDDRKKRELVQKQNYHIREIQRKEGLHIGFLHFQENEEIQWLEERDYDTEYLPQLLAQREQDSFSFSDQQELEKSQENAEAQEVQQVQQENQAPLQTEQAEIKKQPTKEPEMAPLVKLGNEKVQKQPIADKKEQKQEQEQEEEEEQQERDLQDMCLQQQIITSYFKEFSLKVLRKQSEPQYKQTKFLFYPTLQQINWEKVTKHFQCEKLFISTRDSIIFLNHIFSTHQKIKCSIYTLDQQLEEDELRQKIVTCFAKFALVTIKFFPIYTELDEQSLSPFMIGLLLVLLKQNEMPDDYQNKDYIQKGKEIIEDYNCYYYPDQHRSSYQGQSRIMHSSSKEFQKKKKQEADTQQIQQKVEIQSISSKNASTINSSGLNKQPAIQQAQTQQFLKQNNFKKSQSPSKKVHFSNLPSEEAVQETVQESLVYQKQLKRQNSREFLRVEGLEPPTVEYQEPQAQQQQNEQENYQSL